MRRPERIAVAHRIRTRPPGATLEFHARCARLPARGGRIIGFAPSSLGARAPAVTALLALASCVGARPPPSAAGGGTPLEVTRAFYQALHAGDASGAARLADGPHAGEATAAFVELAHAYEALEQALAARFGPAASRAVGYAARVAAEDEALQSARTEVRGDTATVLSEDRPLATLRRAHGAWRVSLEDSLAGEQGLAALVAEAKASSAAVAKVAPAIRGGLFDGPDDALEAFHDEVELAQGGIAPDRPEPQGGSPPSSEGGTEL